METNTALQLDHPDVESRALSLPDQARALRIVDDAGFKRAGEFLLDVKALRKEVDETFDPVIEQAHKAHKTAIAAKKKVEEPIAEAEMIAKRGLSVYQVELDRRAREEEARRMREAQIATAILRTAVAISAAAEAKLDEDARLLAAADAESRGDKEAADRILDEPPATVAVQEPEPVFVPPAAVEQPKLEGVAFREEWHFVVTDARQLPREYLIPDEKKIRAVVRAMKAEAKIPGVRIWPEKGVAARSR